MADGDSKRAKTRSAGATLSANHYRIGLSASFLLWGCILILFFCLGQFKVWVKRDDLIGLAQTTAAVASIAIAVLAYLHDVGSKDRFFRLFLAALTFVLLLGTINGWLAALTMKPPVPPSNEPEFTGLALRFFVAGFIFFCTGVSGGLIVWRGARWPCPFARRCGIPALRDLMEASDPMEARPIEVPTPCDPPTLCARGPMKPTDL